MPTIKAISIRQPWAWLIVNGYKDVENRTWSTKYRGRCLIHTGLKFDNNFNSIKPNINKLSFYDTNDSFFPPYFPQEIPKTLESYQFGGIVGIVNIVDCVSSSQSPWFEGPFGFVLTDAKPLPFIPYKGKLGFFDFDPTE